MLTHAKRTAGDALTEQIPIVMRAALGPHWEFTADDRHIEVRHPNRGTPYRPPSRPHSWEELLDSLQAGFARAGAARDACLPLRWGRETELTISAVQALDPLLKDGQLRTYRSGFLPQPVVRFTGERDAIGNLKDGFLTSFVNISRVQRIGSLDEYGAILDSWLTVLSQLGFHARHISINGELSSWRRRQVEGITLRFRHLDCTLGDIVLLWNTEHSDRLVVDLGSGLERLAWARTQERWHQLIYGSFAGAAPPATLDAIRTATLILGHGITPAARGAGGITRRVIGTIDRDAARLGVGALVREMYGYWSLVGALRPPWAEIARAMEKEMRL
ncbi:hypothetical protein GCM10010313_20200 [Streptomyces violarus]|uniref:Uncharacterized protein n=1 Tax=Streptomyces violarus TaxID=67380 RepID=A0A7W5F0H1_9ACTN|nr:MULTISPECIES: hypothetical protein [Streptomyces]MBB3075542.1 hypothetical protein [Streptomyces violarus]WRT98139.1 hypothetical protein VJ737_10780 [Streptomyces sp. CGMCC 4.1772]GHD04202.1 hypothetical protein GCM10010313_20200 [Streptomyces violarus]